MQSNMALLEVQSDGSVLASGDITKSDEYTLRFENAPKTATALRLEVLPDQSLPAEGPGRAYYEGPKGDFFLSELQIQTPTGPVNVRRATESYAKSGLGGAKVGALQTLDGNPATGWSTHGAQGKANAAVYEFEQPTDLSAGLVLKMQFERHYACPLGRFRIALTTDPKPAEARGHSTEIEAVLAKPAASRTAGETKLLLERFLETARKRRRPARTSTTCATPCQRASLPLFCANGRTATRAPHTSTTAENSPNPNRSSPQASPPFSPRFQPTPNPTVLRSRGGSFRPTIRSRPASPSTGTGRHSSEEGS